jgi:hypothetical protein
LLCSPSPNTVPLPGVHWVDIGYSPGDHVYSYQVLAGTGATIVSSPQAVISFFAVEIG